MKTIYKYTVPVDDRQHSINLTNNPVAAAMTDDASEVEFWAERTNAPMRTRVFQVFGTGHAIPEEAVWVATCARGYLGLVWHLYEIANEPGGKHA